MREIWLIVWDSFRESRSSRLFLVLTVFGLLVVISSFLPGYHEVSAPDGTKSWAITFVGIEIYRVEVEMIAKMAFRTLRIEVAEWVIGWFGLIAAIVSTSFFLPSMLAPGRVESILSRPIPRWRILFAKYLGSLSFVLFHAVLVVAGTYLGFGIRTGDFHPGYLAAIPALLFIFAIVHSVGILSGVLFRSPVVTIFLSVGFWATCSSTDYTRLFIKRQVEAEHSVFSRWLKSADSGEVRLAYDHIAGWRAATLEGVSEVRVPEDVERLCRRFPADHPLKLMTTSVFSGSDRLVADAARRGQTVELVGYFYHPGRKRLLERGVEGLSDATDSALGTVIFAVDILYWVLPKPADILYFAAEITTGRTTEETAREAWEEQADGELEAPKSAFFNRGLTVLSNLGFIAGTLAVAMVLFSRRDF